MATKVQTASSKVGKSGQKKRLVYKQDSDGVFRLKRLSDHEPKDGEADEDEDDGNELIDCSYQVKFAGGESGTEEEQRADDAATENDTAAPVPPPNSRARSQKSVFTHASVPKPKATPTARAKASPKTTAPPSPTSATPEPADIADVGKGPLASFHMPSFGFGAFTAILFIGFSPHVGTYAAIIANVVKHGLIWGLLVGGALWKAGILHLDKSEVLEQMFGGSILGINLRKEIPAEADSRRSGPEVEFKRPSFGKPERRNTSTTVTPFRYVPPPRNEGNKLQSNPELSSDKKHPYKLTKSFSADPRVPRRGSIEARVAHNNEIKRINTNTNHSIPSIDSAESVSSKHSSKPSSEYEELPFINEIRLLEGESDGAPDTTKNSKHRGGHLAALGGSTGPAGSGVFRSNSTASKFSMLQTRANYNKFVSSAPDNDRD
ncbi:Piso0_001465 [Millerozyma farinosa CBS 7064]|uniref:Piso0_001465 protein n=1 Tax=Pichia sorbitophila (strain ATCC MYA-4447 / BCRC 22081 / CBS 7064 / NBRC 10061 / NRRL Y-12695) TaxID=559304 RepID=G8YKV4_PICSO|nr:Piso0_001465 [Millerozyma farinosa CBS 7064]